VEDEADEESEEATVDIVANAFNCAPEA